MIMLTRYRQVKGLSRRDWITTAVDPRPVMRVERKVLLNQGPRSGECNRVHAMASRLTGCAERGVVAR